jgi:hypothetical protein
MLLLEMFSDYIASHDHANPKDKLRLTTELYMVT